MQKSGLSHRQHLYSGPTGVDILFSPTTILFTIRICWSNSRYCHITMFHIRLCLHVMDLKTKPKKKKKKILYAIVYLARFVTCFKAYSKTSQVKTINRVDSYSMFHSSAASKTWPTKTAQDEQCESLTDKPRHPPLFSYLEAPCYCQLDLMQREHEREA